MPSSSASASKRGEAVLREIALAYPEAHEDFPWGERAIKVKNKASLFMRADETGLHATMKLPESHAAALMLPFTEPTPYGLARAAG